MNTAERIYEEVKFLPSQFQQEVLHFVEFLGEKIETESVDSNESKRLAAIKSLRGCAKGEGLLEKLLDSRKRDKERE